MTPPAPKRWPAVDTSSFSHFCVLPNEVRCIFNVSATGDSLRDSNCIDGKGARWHLRPRPRSCTGPGIQPSNCFNALSLTASLKKKLWGNKESSLLWNDEAESFKGNKQPYQEFLQVCRTLPLWDIICSILGEMCHCSFILWLPGDTEVYRLETKRKKK